MGFCFKNEFLKENKRFSAKSSLRTGERSFRVNFVTEKSFFCPKSVMIERKNVLNLFRNGKETENILLLSKVRYDRVKKSFVLAKNP